MTNLSNWCSAFSVLNHGAIKCRLIIPLLILVSAVFDRFTNPGTLRAPKQDYHLSNRAFALPKDPKIKMLGSKFQPKGTVGSDSAPGLKYHTSKVKPAKNT